MLEKHQHPKVVEGELCTVGVGKDESYSPNSNQGIVDLNEIHGHQKLAYDIRLL